MYYAEADAQGNIIAYYTDELNYPNGIPKTAITITDEQWADSINNPGKYVVQNGQLVEAAPPSAEELLEQAKQAKLTELQGALQDRINAVYTDPSVTDVTAAINQYRQTYFARQQQIQSASTVADVQAVPTSF